MTNTIQFKRGLEAGRTGETPAAGEPIWTTDGKKLYVGDGSTAGGVAIDSGITDVVDDTTPQLGGDLDVNGNSITSTSNGAVTLAPNGTGDVVIDIAGTSDDGSAVRIRMLDTDVITFENTSANTVTMDLAANLTVTGAEMEFGASASVLAGQKLILDNTAAIQAGGSATLTATSDAFVFSSNNVTFDGNIVLANGTIVGDDGSNNIITTAVGINDASNDIFTWTGNGSAVNNVNIANATTGNGPAISAEGSDTNIDIVLTPKGTGVLDNGGYEISKRIATTLNDNQSSADTIFSYTGTDYDGVWIDYVISRGSGIRRMGTFRILNDGTNITYSDDSDSIGTNGVTLTATISTGTVSWQYTSTSTGTAPDIAYTIRRMNG